MSKELIERLRNEGDGVMSRREKTQIAARIEELERERDALQAHIARLRKALKKMNRTYVGLMENARDRIIMLGGDCDPVDVMEYSDQNLRESRAALSVTPEQSLARLRNQVLEEAAKKCEPTIWAEVIRAMKEPE